MQGVAIGGGHGLSASLEALRLIGADVTAIVGVADDGGSTGMLRDVDPSLPAIGDARRILSTMITKEHATAARLLEYRLKEGPLAGHAVGNLMLAALRDLSGSFQGALSVVGGWFGAEGRVIPASEEPMRLCASTVGGDVVCGQLKVHETAGIDRVWLEPEAEACADAVAAIESAEVVVLGPGSLYTSVLASAIIPGIREALARTRAAVVFLINLRPQANETIGFDLADHLDALSRHGVRFDYCIADPRFSGSGETASKVALIEVGDREGRWHQPDLLAKALASLTG